SRTEMPLPMWGRRSEARGSRTTQGSEEHEGEAGNRSGVAVVHQFEKRSVNAGVVAEFGMERGGHGFSLPDGDGIFTLSCDHFDAGADLLDLGRPNEHHLEGGLAQLSRTNRAVDLPAVGVAPDADVNRCQAGLG